MYFHSGPRDTAGPQKKKKREREIPVLVRHAHCFCTLLCEHSTSSKLERLPAITWQASRPVLSHSSSHSSTSTPVSCTQSWHFNHFNFFFFFKFFWKCSWSSLGIVLLCNLSVPFTLLIYPSVYAKKWLSQVSVLVTKHFSWQAWLLTYILLKLATENYHICHFTWSSAW